MTTRKPKLRFLSALLAVAMLLTLLPTAAFAEDTSAVQTETEVKGLILNADGTEPVNLDEEHFTKMTDKNGNVTWTPKPEYGSGWTWSGTASKMYLNIGTDKDLKNKTYYVWDLTTADAPSQLNLYISNYGIIKCADTTEFEQKVYNRGIIYAGKAKFEEIRNYDTSVLDGGVVKELDHNSGAILKNALVYGTGSIFAGTVEDSILPKAIDGSVKLMASDCIINDKLNGTAYVVGSPDSIKIVAPFNKFNKNALEGWLVNGAALSESGLLTKSDTFNEEGAVLEFAMPANYTESELKITAVCERTPLAVNNEGLPVDKTNSRYDGSQTNDGWTYTYKEDTLEDGTAVKLNEKLRIYPTYEGEAALTGATIPYAVKNMAVLNGGIYTDTLESCGTVKNVTVSGKFFNNTEELPEDDGSVTVLTGEVISGVFSRSADFGDQNPDITWLNVNGGVVNGIDSFSMAGIVGDQSVIVTAADPESFNHWSVSGDSGLTLSSKELTSPELTLNLSGSKKKTIVLTAETNALPGVLTAKDFVFKAPADLTADGTAKNAAVTTKKTGVGEIALHYYDVEGNLLAKAPTKAGTYTVTIDVAGTDKYEATTLSDPDWSFTVAEKTYNVTVVNGVSAMTTAAAGAKVTVKANAAPTGQKFSKWVSDSENVLFVEKTDAETSFIMPEGDVTITAAYEKLPEKPKPEPEVKSYMLHVFDGETEVEGVLVSEAKAGETVTVRLLRNAIPGGQMFDHWEALPETLELKDASAAETTFVMPEEAVTLRAVYRDIVVAPVKPSTASVVAATAVVGTGVVLAGWTAYNMGMELYAKWVLPAGAEMPATRGELATLLWQEAGSPEPADAVETMTDAEKAAQWAVESGLMTESKDAGFAPEKKVGRLEVFMTLKKAETLKK